MRKKGTLSKAAAARITRPELAGETVEYEDHPEGHPFRGINAANVYYNGKWIAGAVELELPSNGIRAE